MALTPSGWAEIEFGPVWIADCVLNRSEGTVNAQAGTNQWIAQMARRKAQAIGIKITRTQARHIGAATQSWGWPHARPPLGAIWAAGATQQVIEGQKMWAAACRLEEPGNQRTAAEHFVAITALATRVGTTIREDVERGAEAALKEWAPQMSRHQALKAIKRAIRKAWGAGAPDGQTQSHFGPGANRRMVWTLTPNAMAAHIADAGSVEAMGERCTRRKGAMSMLPRAQVDATTLAITIPKDERSSGLGQREFQAKLGKELDNARQRGM